ncbi:dihydrolipoyl dehydrogenase family protein [Fructobacillus ficulneus]|uniref:Glutathione reductase n=1 Tax=Fructobacillus ficulneus TaxID=157463 RepID=A0A0K8MHA4_9LACO|nr:NAD(P)/FAD-dependent oxidoreductase [Fructobacillus ficulneus]GAO99269.1 glutathione reductase [Fructobacillus ficulneus]
MTAYDYDVLYLGAGHGAFDGAPLLASAGKKVAFVEREKVGGTCPNWGCNAKVILENAAALQRQLVASDGIVEGSGKIDWTKNMARKKEIISIFPNAIQSGMEGLGIDFIFGNGEFLDAHTIQVGDRQVTAENIVIATGMHSHRLDIPGAEYLHDSKDFLSLDEAPEKMVVIGAGYIGLESAAMMNAAGVDVTVIMHSDKALNGFNKTYTDALLASLEKQGLTFVRNSETTEVEKLSHGFAVKTSTGTYDADYILDATGRVPNTAGLGLEKVGIDFDQTGIKVNEYLQTALPNVYATGDVVSKTQPKLTPTATFESQYVANYLLGNDTKPVNYPAIATNVFTSPRLAQAGVTLDEAAAHPDQFDVVEKKVMDDWYRLVDYETEGQLSLIYDKDHRLVGAIELSDHAEDIINSLLPAIEFGYTPAQLARLVTVFPTIGYSAIGDLL